MPSSENHCASFRRQSNAGALLDTLFMGASVGVGLLLNIPATSDHASHPELVWPTHMDLLYTLIELDRDRSALHTP
jgi:hypothetical protein